MNFKRPFSNSGRPHRDRALVLGWVGCILGFIVMAKTGGDLCFFGGLFFFASPFVAIWYRHSLRRALVTYLVATAVAVLIGKLTGARSPADYLSGTSHNLPR